MSRLPEGDPAVRDEGAGGGRRAARGAVAAASTTRRSHTVRSDERLDDGIGRGAPRGRIPARAAASGRALDEVGRAEVVDYLPEAVTPTPPETLFFIRRFVVDQYERRAAVLEERRSRSFHFVSQSLADALVVEHADAATGWLSGRLRDEVRVEDVAIRVVPSPEPPYGAEARFDRVTCVARRETSRADVTLGLQLSFTAVDRALVFDNPWCGDGQRRGEDAVGGAGPGAAEGVRSRAGCVSGQVAAWPPVAKVGGIAHDRVEMDPGSARQVGRGVRNLPFGTRGQP